MIFVFETFFRSKKIYFFEVEKKVWVQLRFKKSISFDWRGFQGDSGTPPWVLEQFSSDKLKMSVLMNFDEFSYGIFELTGLVGVPTGVNSEQKHDF